MKKILKIITHLSSILSLAVFVFLSSVMVKVVDRGGADKDGGKGLKSLMPSLEFGINYASADIPVSAESGSSTLGGWGGDCDGAGAGASADGGGGGGTC